MNTIAWNMTDRTFRPYEWILSRSSTYLTGRYQAMEVVKRC